MGYILVTVAARAISSLTSNGVEINKEMWMKEAVDAEKGDLLTHAVYPHRVSKTPMLCLG